MTAKVLYLDGLKTKMIHTKSGFETKSSAPLDNMGDGLAFSPTDYLAVSLASCILTVIGIYCDKNGLILEAESSVTKTMTKNPRRIASLHVDIEIKNKNFSQRNKERMMKIGDNCPVALSLHPEIELKTNYVFKPF